MAIIVGGSDSPQLVYGKALQERPLIAPIHFVDGKYSATAEIAKVFETFTKTGQIITDDNSYNPDKPVSFLMGDIVEVSTEGIDWMIENHYHKEDYWLKKSSHRIYTISGFFTSGTRCICSSGVLPPFRFLSLVERPKSKEVIDNDYVSLILERIHAYYGDGVVNYSNKKELEEVRQNIIDGCTANGHSLNGMVVETSNGVYLKVIPEHNIEESLIEFLMDADEYYLGSFNTSVYSGAFPQFSKAMISLHESESFSQLGDMIKGLDDGVKTMVTFLINKHGSKSIVADFFGHYDGKALEFVYYGKKYYIARQD